MRAPVGGLFRHVLDLASEQARRGHAVGILADRNASDGLTAERLAAAAPLLELGITLIPMSRQPGIGDLTAAFAVYRRALKLGVGVLHGHGAKGGAYARLAALALKAHAAPVACFYTPHGGSLHFDPGTLRGRLITGLEKPLRLATDGLIFESAYARRAYAKLVGCGQTPVRVIPNGLKPGDFITHEPAAGAADFLFIGELRRIKGVDVLLHTVAELNKTDPVRAVIVGTGPDAGELEAMARSLDLESRVTFPGAMPAREAFPLGRCLVVPSRGESFPYIVLEAAAAGIALIATQVGGIPEIVAGSDTPLIPAGDGAALAAAMSDFLAAPEAAIARARRLKAVVGERFTVEAMTEAVLDFYATADAD
jgi:glycosyltransferase involved in cell wall biosynthesis